MILIGKNSGFDMNFDTDTGIYQLLEGEEVLKESKSLEAIDKYIENIGKGKKRKFERVSILWPKTIDLILDIPENHKILEEITSILSV